MHKSWLEKAQTICPSVSVMLLGWVPPFRSHRQAHRRTLRRPAHRADPPHARNGVASSRRRYWLGEWICADCGYIYGSRGEQQPFETLGRCIRPLRQHKSACLRARDHAPPFPRDCRWHRRLAALLLGEGEEQREREYRIGDGSMGQVE